MEGAMKTAVRVGLLMAGLTTAACGGRDGTGDNVRKALDQANLQKVGVTVDQDANIVHLTGSVESSGVRTRAQEVAAAAVGTSGQVLNELTIVGLNDETADDLDDQIGDTLEKMVKRDAALTERDIDFTVVNGMVTVKGKVASADEKNRVTQIAKAAPGVKDVANGLEIKSAN